MIPDGSHEQMEPPECDADDVRMECQYCDREATSGDALCTDCAAEFDEMNGIHPNGTEETVKISLPKFKTSDGRGTCGLDFAHDHLRCPLIRVRSFGRHHLCSWTGVDIYPDNPDGTGYLRPCENCPIHKSP